LERKMMYAALRGFRNDPEELAGKHVEWKLLRRVFRLARPYRWLLAGFLFTAVAASITTVIPPLLFRSLLDTAVPDKNRALVAWLAAGAVVLAIANALLSLWQRWYSARIGEGLIYTMRVRLFDHIQRMPVSFFTRTQTGALMSRMNNDVIGAQQAITNTLGTVVGNIITLAVTLTVMLGLEWRLTILTLIVLPAFIIPARRIGRRLQRITREGMQLNASMNNTIAERFNVAGALVVKLFGKHDRERDQFEGRADRVRDIGVATAMYSPTWWAATS
jgi:ATP-binding cassette, subfamily B, bacterial